MAVPDENGERLRLRQLILPDRASAEKARERLAGGADFEALSREMSRAPNATEGGAIRWVERGQLPPEFEAAVFAPRHRPAEHAGREQRRLHVFQVVERQTAAAPPRRRPASGSAPTSPPGPRKPRAAMPARPGRTGRGAGRLCRVAFECTDPFKE